MSDDRRVAWIDLETGGLDSERHQIVEIASIVTDCSPALVELDRFERRIGLVEGWYTKEALEINRYSKERWADAVNAQTAARDLDTFLRPHCLMPCGSRNVIIVGGHNYIEFDKRFIVNLGKRTDTRFPLAHITGYMVDTIHMAQTLRFASGEDINKFSLGALLERLKVPFDIERLHTAMGDVTATVTLARTIITALKLV